MQKKLIIGWHKFFSRNKNQWYLVVDTVSPITDYDKSAGYHGSKKVEQIFVPESLWPLFENQPDDAFIGKEFMFEYVISGRYSNLDNITLAK